MKTLSDSAIEYMDRVWGFSTAGGVDDFAMLWENGEYEILALRLVNAGAVEPNCKEAEEIIAVADSVTWSDESAVLHELLPKHTIIECGHCHYVHFISAQYDHNDWLGDNPCSGCNQSGKMEITQLREAM